MPKRNGGRSGKSRRNHNRRRANRLHARQLIDDYMTEGEDDGRHIPIRHRGEFNPTAVKAVADESQLDVQLELPLGEYDDSKPYEYVDAQVDEMVEEMVDEASEIVMDELTSDQAAVRLVANDDDADSLEPDPAPVSAFGNVGAADHEEYEDEDIPEPLPTNHYEMFEFSSKKQKEPFSIRKFLVGCALGGGMAAALLLMLRLIF